MKNDYVLILSAASFSAEKHRTCPPRKDVDETPYINHPLEVARILAEEGGVNDVEVLAAALLHDTIEDTETSAGELRDWFGKRIADLVVEVSDDKTLEKAIRKQLQIDNASKKTIDAALISLGDKIANVRDIGERPPTDWSNERRLDYLTWASNVVDGLPMKDHPLVGVFNRAIDGARRLVNATVAPHSNQEGISP